MFWGTTAFGGEAVTVISKKGGESFTLAKDGRHWRGDFRRRKGSTSSWLLTIYALASVDSRIFLGDRRDLCVSAEATGKVGERLDDEDEDNAASTLAPSLLAGIIGFTAVGAYVTF